MNATFPEYKNFDLSAINKEIQKKWEEEKTFEKSLTTRADSPAFVFFEGPPSANGMPGIHHVISRTIKDIFCRYKTLKGFKVDRKAGWDTHGLPVELGVEKLLGITKEDIGKKITVDEYNDACRREVMKYTDKWEELTKRMGYWVDMENPYITYDNRYIETLWYLLKELYKKGLLYKGYSIQPFSPAAGTGLSSHELNQPGCYRDVKDTTGVAQFKIVRNQKSEFLYLNADEDDVHFLAWTTTPWTLLSNTALALGSEIEYAKVRSFNRYTGKPIVVILAYDRVKEYFPDDCRDLELEDYKFGDKKIPFKIISLYKGRKLDAIRYEQLLPYKYPETGDAFRVVMGDFVTTSEGTGIVHIAPSFGADDFKVARLNDIGSLTLVDRQGKFVEGTGEFSGKYVKNQYDSSLPADALTVDEEIVIKLKKEDKLFKSEKYVHSYPHCWRTDKPVLYYPLDSWFIRTTAMRDRLIELNKTINWQPPATGSGRFGSWLENLVDWNLSRSRYWGTPLPIWVSEDRTEQLCIGSVAELKAEIEKSVKAGFMDKNPLANFVEGDNSKANYDLFDLHRPYVDNIVLVSPKGKKMMRELDLIDVWFDSGAMPYAQWHYPFEHKEDFGKLFPADFIAEGVDQTRGWFFTLHAIATMISDSVSFKNIVSNGLVLDKDGNKMSKRIGNVVEPFSAFETYGADPLRWYMTTNSTPWENLKFDISGVDEVRRKFFGTLYNTYSFFALYANVDGFTFKEKYIPVEKRPEIDRWIISLLNTLVKETGDSFEEYHPTKAGRMIQDFVIDHLSNWYVRLNRKRFWGGEYNDDKIAAYQTLYECLMTVAKLASPIAPFFADKIYHDLNQVSGLEQHESVHLSYFPTYNETIVDKGLEERMAMAQDISSMVLSLRRKVSIKVRQPLNKLIVPILDNSLAEKLEAVKNIILTEVNVKELEYITDTTGILIKKIKPDFKMLGKKMGKKMKALSNAIAEFTQNDISSIEKQGFITLELEGEKYDLLKEEVEIISEDIPGWQVASDGKLTVALDITITSELKEEGIARELINRIQNLRKDSGFEVTDKINIELFGNEAIAIATNAFSTYIADQTLAQKIVVGKPIENNANGIKYVDIDEMQVGIKIERAIG